MTTHTTVISTFRFTEKEREALYQTHYLLGALADILKEEDTIQNIGTGEIIEVQEFHRVRGILSGLLEGYAWERVSESEESGLAER